MIRLNEVEIKVKRRWEESEEPSKQSDVQSDQSKIEQEIWLSPNAERLLFLISVRCDNAGYCFSWYTKLLDAFNKSHKRGISERTLYNLLNELEVSGQIIREHVGKRSIIWIKETYENRQESLGKFDPKTIGTKKFNDKLYDVKKEKFIGKKQVQKQGIFCQNVAVDLQSNCSDVAAINRELKNKDIKKKEVVYIAASENKPIPEKKAPPSYQKDYTPNTKLETLSIEEETKLYENFEKTIGKEIVALKISNSLKHMVRMRDQGNTRTAGYRKGAMYYARLWCKEVEDRKVATVESKRNKVVEAIDRDYEERLTKKVAEAKTPKVAISKKCEEEILSLKQLINPQDIEENRMKLSCFGLSERDVLLCSHLPTIIVDGTTNKANHDCEEHFIKCKIPMKKDNVVRKIFKDAGVLLLSDTQIEIRKTQQMEQYFGDIFTKKSPQGYEYAILNIA